MDGEGYMTTSLNVDFVREQFPPLKDGWVFLENAGGSYVPRQVIERVTEYMTDSQVQPNWGFASSERATERIRRGLRTAAEFINAEPDEVFIGPSTTMNGCSAAVILVCAIQSDSGVAQAFEALGRKASFELGRPAEPGHIEVRGEVAKRIQNEVPLHYPAMREGQAGLLPPLPAKDQEVEVDDTGSPVLVLRGPAERPLQGQQLPEQGAGIELREHPGHRIDEIRLRYGTEGLGAVQRGEAHQPRSGEGAQRRAGTPDLGPRIR